ncbi:MAG: FMN phosphatase YigB (HAD superfamily) [Sphingobacteriales bacterium]|jgi:FMN phosphatase YigB (HAD superfamily)
MDSFFKLSMKNIIFDLGGVILNIDYFKTSDAFKALGGVQFDAIYSQAQQNHLFDDFETGTISEKVFFDELNTLLGGGYAQKALINAWNAMLLDFPLNRIEKLEQLGQKYRIFLLSNTNETHLAAFKTIAEKSVGYSRFVRCFEQVFYSHEIGARKPNPHAFWHVLNAGELNPAETLFIDDSAQHLLGAKECGIQAQLLAKGAEFSDLLNALVDYDFS